jgi:outer membrane protein OmpA-like peptidoglycan-associated protein
MRRTTTKTVALSLVAMLAVPLAGPLLAQQIDPADPSIVVTGERIPALDTLPAGPDVKGIITARKGDQMKVTTAAGPSSVITIAETTKIKSSSGLFGGKGKLTTASLLNGIPVTVKTLQWNGGLVAKEVTFKNNDYKTAMMIRNGTNQRFEENEAATEALRGRMADIDNYNLKGTTNVFFDTGKTILSEKGKADLCSAASQAESTSNALLLVVGYTDSVGDEDYNQTLSEKRASRVINYLQQVCKWKPYRMLTPTGMAESDPLADNSTEDGRAQNRRVSVNILVSKSVDGI